MRPREADLARLERVTSYREIAAGLYGHGARGKIAFVVSTDDLSEGKGDLFVALVLARALREDGWGITLWPTERYAEEMPSDIDIAIVMIESFVPGLIDRRTRLVGWVRNWADVWAGLPYLHEFDALWCSSAESADLVRAAFGGDIRVVPIATDPVIFAPSAGSERQRGVVTTANFWGVERSISEALRGLAEVVPVAWFGRNGQYIPSLGSIEHRGLVAWTELDEVYSGWAIVLDDLIPTAARYGNQNSRLFDALACGAFVVTNESRGLADLGLDEVASYSSPDALVPLVDELLSDAGALAERTARLRAVVLERHTGEARATVLRDHLTGLVPGSTASRGPREQMLRWASTEREHLRSQRHELDRARHDLQIAAATQRADVKELERELRDERARSAALRDQLAHIRSSRTYRVARRASQFAARFRRR